MNRTVLRSAAFTPLQCEPWSQGEGFRGQPGPEGGRLEDLALSSQGSLKRPEGRAPDAIVSATFMVPMQAGKREGSP